MQLEANRAPFDQEGRNSLTEGEHGKAISVSLWETEADMTAGKSSGDHQLQLARFTDWFAAPPVREAYEIDVQPWAETYAGQRTCTSTITGFGKGPPSSE